MKSREPSGPQDELLEIINDFKNNVFTITEVERLVENWRNRNDVQQSFKDKQRQLTAMREEYERIQKRMKEEMKAPTPFDRIRKFFSKGKKGSFDIVYNDIVIYNIYIYSLILVLYFYFVILFRFKRFFEWK